MKYNSRNSARLKTNRNIFQKGIFLFVSNLAEFLLLYFIVVNKFAFIVHYYCCSFYLLFITIVVHFIYCLLLLVFILFIVHHYCCSFYLLFIAIVVHYTGVDYYCCSFYLLLIILVLIATIKLHLQDCWSDEEDEREKKAGGADVISRTLAPANIDKVIFKFYSYLLIYLCRLLQ